MSNQLDNLFKNKLRDRSFEYDESAWEDARLLIEESEKNKKRRKWFVLFSSLLLISIVGFAAYYLGRESVQPMEQPTTNETIAGNISTENVSSVTSTFTNPSKDERAVGTQEILANSGRNVVANKSLEINKSHSNITATTRRKNRSNKRAENINTKETDQNASGAAGVTKSSDTPITTTYNPIINAAATLEQSNSSSAILQKEDRLAAISLIASQVALLDFDINNSLLDLLPEMIKNPKGKFEDTSVARWFFGLRAGAALVPSAFTNFEGGAFLQYSFSRNISLSFQPHYTYQELSQQKTNETIIINGFGLRTAAFSLSPETIRSIHAPLLFSYSFGKKNLDLNDTLAKRYLKHKLSTGLSYVYLDGITGSILQKESAGATSEFENGWLDNAAFNRHNAEVLFGYEYYLTKRLSLGTLLRYRIRNQFSDAFLQRNTTVEKTSPFYIGLQASYRLN